MQNNKMKSSIIPNVIQFLRKSISEATLLPRKVLKDQIYTQNLEYIRMKNEMKSTTITQTNENFGLELKTKEKEQNDNESQLLKQFAVTSLDGADGNAIEIRPPKKHEAFAPTGNRITLSVLIKRIYGSNGEFLYEDYYPLTLDLIPELNGGISQVTFHGCHSLKDGFFIYPQKNSSKAAPSNWNCSLGKALKTPPGTYISLNVNTQMERYEANPYKGPASPPPAFVQFEKALSDALSQIIVKSVEHPLAQALLNK